jgi:hypothetical protein
MNKINFYPLNNQKLCKIMSKLIIILFLFITSKKIRGRYESRDSRVSLESWHSRSRSNPLETLARLSKFVIVCKINEILFGKMNFFQKF